ncbi:FxsA family membrane protein [Streptomyces sp. TRM49041]|uniref:FxsA family membrane protein n=1 Tax=Streptomyces sp. TRM49041 TaxID=2603216 RepID=UPI0011F05131|nr:FxsA family membrane protein [Streptomyces sp. TRM49041]
MTTGAPPPPVRGRSRARTLAPLGIAAWLVLEIWLLTLVADAAGGLTVLALLIGGGVLGAAVIKRAGRRAFTTLTEQLQRQQAGAQPPSTADRGSGGNGMLMLGGLLLMLPGLISDALGLLLLIPPLRTALAGYVERSVDRRMGAVLQQARIHRPDGKVVQGEVIRDDDRRGPGPGNDDGSRPPLTP